MTMLLKASTNVVRYFMMRKVSDGTAFTGATITTFDLQYTRELEAAATKIDAIVGTGGATTHVDNKVFEVDATNSPGLYMVCFPDAAFATGVDQVTLNLKYDATVFTEAQNIQLVAFDPFAALATPTNITAGTITNVANLHASAATAAAQTTAQNDLDIITGSDGALIAAGAINSAAFDTTAGSFNALGVVDQGTAQSATATTMALRSAAAFADDELIGAVILIVSATAGAGQMRAITDYDSATDTATVDTWTTTPTGTIVYKVFAAPPGPTTLPTVNVTQVNGTSQTAGDLAALITTVDIVVDSILVDTAAGGAGPWTTGAGGSAPTVIEIRQEMDSNSTQLAAIVADTNELQTDNVPGLIAALDTVVDTVKGDTAAILIDTAEIGTAGAGLTSLPWNATWDAEVESEVNDALNTAVAELTGVPSATPSLREATMLPFMALRNKLDVQTSATDALEVHNDAGALIASKLITDDGADYSEAKMV